MGKKKEGEALVTLRRAQRIWQGYRCLYRRTMFFFIKLFGMIFLLLMMEYLSSSSFYFEQLGCGFCVSFLQYVALDIWQSTAPEILSTLTRCIVFWAHLFVVILLFFQISTGEVSPLLYLCSLNWTLIVFSWLYSFLIRFNIYLQLSLQKTPN